MNNSTAYTPRILKQLLAIALLGGVGGQVNAGLVGYQISGVVSRVSGFEGTVFEGTQLGDVVNIEFLFDPTEFASDFKSTIFIWDYIISSLSLEIGGVSPSGLPTNTTPAPAWTMDNGQLGDRFLVSGGFTSGEFIVATMLFDPDTFEPATDPAMTLPPLNLADANFHSTLGHMINQNGGSLSFDITSIAFIPIPGPGTLGALAVGLLAASKRRR